ncbi:hypothetical protein OAX78_01870, partial [Planctomycetota bacterium]|nr:hypothetical protein [Planctomycetota bacterium]
MTDTGNPTIDASLLLSQELIALGEFLGLLRPGSRAGTVEINRGWFTNPHGSLASSGQRFDRLVELISLTLGPPTPTATPPASSGLPNLLWYPIPALDTATRTAFHVVSSPVGALEGELGLGVLFRWGAQEAPVDVCGYVPLVKYGPAGADLVLATPDYPARILLRAGGDDTVFQVGRTRGPDPSAGEDPIRFTALDLSAVIDLSGSQTQRVWLEFEDVDGPGVSGPITSLQGLLDPTVQLQLLAVLVQASGWLSLYVGNAPFNVGEVLETAGFLSRNSYFTDPNFLAIELLRERLIAPNKAAEDPISEFVWNNLEPRTQEILLDANAGRVAWIQALRPDLNGILDQESIFTDARFEKVVISVQADTLLADKRLTGGNGAESDGVRRLNWWLLHDAYPGDFGINPYALILDELQETSPLDIALNFVFAVLDSLAAADFPIISLPGSGVWVIRRTHENGAAVYGLRVAGEITLVGDDPLDEVTSETPATRATLAAGTWLANEDQSNNWLVRSGPAGSNLSEFPGLSLSFLRRGPAPDHALSFDPTFELSSVGLDLTGRADAPLFNIGGYTLAGAQVRVFFNSSDGLSFGVGAALTGLGVPLGPGFGQATEQTDNKVAQSLLGSGGDEAGGTRPDGDQDPVNPAFGLALSWVSGGQFVTQLLDGTGAPSEQLLIPIQRSFGPLECERIGISWRSEDKTLSFLFWGGLELRAMHVGVDGLVVSVPIDAPGDFSRYGFDLAGVAVSLETSSVAFSAALEKLQPDPNARPPRDFIQYDGAASLRVGKVAFAALGSYAYVGSGNSGFTSLFTFALLRAPLGDPTGTGVFFFNGLSAGFGYNRGLVLPAIDQVANFPLVAGIADPSKLGGSSSRTPSPAEALAALGNSVPPERGQFWLAAGAFIVSVDLVQTSALVSVSFGNEVEIGLTGL